MANDYKRMWTREEIKSNSVVELPDIPEVVDANSPDIIRVQGKLYYKKEESGLLNKTFKWNDSVDISTSLPWFKLSFTSNNENFVGFRVQNYSTSQGVVKYATSLEMQYGEYINIVVNQDYSDIIKDEYKTFTITGGDDINNEKLSDYIYSNAKQIKGETTFEYLEVGDLENIIKEIPTDVNIVKDQSEWQLQLEHDSRVLSITNLTDFAKDITKNYVTTDDTYDYEITLTKDVDSYLYNFNQSVQAKYCLLSIESVNATLYRELIPLYYDNGYSGGGYAYHLRLKVLIPSYSDDSTTIDNNCLSLYSSSGRGSSTFSVLAYKLTPIIDQFPTTFESIGEIKLRLKFFN